ncbi:E3 ubiquitin-protein ligase RNF13, partial [Cuculus canorus]
EVFGYVAYNDISKCIAYEALPARFGPPLPAEGLTEYLMRVIPPNSCHAIENPPAPRKTSKTYIAVIERRNCSFAEKVLHAQSAGYKTIIVYNVDPEKLLTMMAGGKETKQLIKIPSLFAGQLISLHLERTSQGKKKVLRVLPAKHYLDLSQDNGKMLKAVSIVQDFRAIFHIVYTIMATISIMIGMSLYKRACKINLHVYKQGDKYETCVICLAEYQEGECLKILSCSHVYHSTCVDTWFYTQSGKKMCPICKQVV